MGDSHKHRLNNERRERRAAAGSVQVIDAEDSAFTEAANSKYISTQHGEETGLTPLSVTWFGVQDRDWNAFENVRADMCAEFGISVDFRQEAFLHKSGPMSVTESDILAVPVVVIAGGVPLRKISYADGDRLERYYDGLWRDLAPKV